MSLVTRSTSASMDTSTGMFAPQATGNLYAGEALDAVAPCYIKASDGLVYMSNATNQDEAAKIDGWTARATALGQPVTLFGVGARFRYGTSLTPGANYYLGATAGRIDTAATTGGAIPVARAINSTDIRILRNDEGAGLAVSGVANGYKVARGETALDGSNPTPVATGLTTVVAFVATLKGSVAPGVGTSSLTAVISGATANVYAWKVTSSSDTTLVASTGTESFYWVAVGT